MATFKVGQRVRVIAVDADASPAERVILGREAVIIADCVNGTLINPRGYDWALEIPDLRNPNGGNWAAFSYQLAPLTDPLAEQFLERIRNLQPLDEPVSA